METVHQNTKKIKLDFNLDLAVLVLIDEQMLHTILRNLISNSIKFTDANKNIYISLMLINYMI